MRGDNISAPSPQKLQTSVLRPSKNKSEKPSPVVCGMSLLAKYVLKSLLLVNMPFGKGTCFICVQFIFSISGKELIAVDVNISRRHDVQI